MAICGYTGSAKVFAAPRVAGTKATRAFNCGAHTSAVYHCAFSDDTMVMATVSKDGTCRNLHTASPIGRRGIQYRECLHTAPPIGRRSVTLVLMVPLMVPPPLQPSTERGGSG